MIRSDYLLFCCVVLCSFASVAAQQDPVGTKSVTSAPYTEVERVMSAFWQTLRAGDTRKAFDDLLTNSKIREKDEQVQRLVEQARKSTELYGEIRGQVLVEHKSISSSLIKLRYMVEHRSMPMSWTIVFYKTSDKGWTVLNVKFDDRIESFFEE